MPTIKAVAYNTGSTIANTTQYGNIAVGTGDQDYSGLGGLQWWASTDLDTGYAIVSPNPNGNTPNDLSLPCYLSFWKTNGFNVNEYISLASYVTSQNFTSITQTENYLLSNGYWSSYSEVGSGSFTVINNHPTLIINQLAYGLNVTPTFDSGSYPLSPSQQLTNSTTNFSPQSSWSGSSLSTAFILAGSGSGVIRLYFDDCVVFQASVNSSSNISYGFSPLCSGQASPLTQLTEVKYILSQS